MVEHPLDQTARRDDVVERADRPVKPEVDARYRCGLHGVEIGKGRKAVVQRIGDKAAHAVEGDRQDHEVGGDRLARAEGHPADRPIVVRFDRADPGRQPDRDAMIAQPAVQPRAVELAQRDQRQLQLEPRPVAEEAIKEDLAGVADVHLVEPLVQGRDEDGGPEQVDGMRMALPVRVKSQSANDSPGRSSRFQARQARP